jgi:uncharacterized membrane protein YgcG
MLDIPAGKDNGFDIVSEARKMLARPVNKELKDQMSWLPVRYTEIVQNLSLRTVGLQDCVMTSAIEQCHDLTSKIEIKNFSPTNLRNSAKSKRQTAKYDEGKLVVESEDIYGDLETVNDVILAFNTLGSIWQKLHPHWPVANIGLRVCFTMKLFAHCEDNARKVMIEWANRYLQANSSRAANVEGPMSYERAFNLAGTVCRENDYEKEPPATKGRGVHPVAQPPLISGRGRGGGGRGRGDRGGRGGSAGGGRGDGQGRGRSDFYGVMLASGDAICKFYNFGNCQRQSSVSCMRDNVTYKHVCDFKKGQNYCQGSHKKSEHDPTKH